MATRQLRVPRCSFAPIALMLFRRVKSRWNSHRSLVTSHGPRLTNRGSSSHPQRVAKTHVLDAAQDPILALPLVTEPQVPRHLDVGLARFGHAPRQHEDDDIGRARRGVGLEDIDAAVLAGLE